MILNLIFGAFYIAILALIALVDVKTRKIPNKILLLLFGIGAIQHLVLWDIPMAFAGGLVSLAMFFLVYKASKAKIGLGDIKFGFVVGWVLGYPSVLLFLLVVGVLSLLGALQKINKIPFAPFMVTGALAALVWGDGFVKLLER